MLRVTPLPLSHFLVMAEPPAPAAQRPQAAVHRYYECGDRRAREEHPDVLAPKPPTNTGVYGFTSRSIVWREVVESIARRGDSVSLGERRRIRFPSVRLQPPRCAARWRRTGCPSLLAPAVTMSHSNSTTRTASWCRSMGLNHRALSIAWIVIERTRAVV